MAATQLQVLYNPLRKKSFDLNYYLNYSFRKNVGYQKFINISAKKAPQIFFLLKIMKWLISWQCTSGAEVPGSVPASPTMFLGRCRNTVLCNTVKSIVGHNGS